MIFPCRLAPLLAITLRLAAAAVDSTNSSESPSASCACDEAPVVGEKDEERHVIRILNLQTNRDDFSFMGIEETASEYEERHPGVRIELDWINDSSLKAAELKAQLQSGLPLYDAFVAPSRLIGYAAQWDGFMDLTEIVRTRPELKWSDIFLGFRDNVAVYDKRVYLFPLDGDANYMFYRADVLEALNLTVPRTWEEYWRVAQAVHLKEYQGKIMYGSCLGRKAGEGAGAFWAMDVLSSYTQTQGKAGGFLFDPKDLTPLMGEAMAEAIKMLEMQVRFGHPNEFEGEAGGLPGSINVVAMNIGECALTINWGDSFTQSYAEGSQIVGKMKVGALPGADKVLNRETMRLEPCIMENCGDGLGGVEYSDIGWVNTAQFLAGGGWAGAVNNNVDAVRKERVIDFFVHMCSPEPSTRNLIRKAPCDRSNATGVDPFRASHFDVIDRWVDAGYDKKAVESYREAVVKTAANPNAAHDLRFAGGEKIYDALAEEVQKYLELARLGELPESEEEKQALRMKIANKISERFTQIVKEEDAKPETTVSVLEQYQRDLGIFAPDVNTNQLGDLRIVGMVLMTIALACALSFGMWIFVCSSNAVVRYSQPIFLYLLCAGAFVMSSAIVPLSIDDSFYGGATDDCPGCTKACIAWPWLFCLGFSIIFSTLFSKLWRINKLIQASIQFRRIEVQPKDVMLPMAIILGLNTCLLSVWTAADPPQWQRIWTNELNSYGACSFGDGGVMTVSKIIISLLAIVNISALVLAAIQAYKARTITSEVLSESKYISLAIFGNLEIFLIGLPLAYIVNENPAARYFLSVGIIFLVSAGMLLLIFVPKIWFARHPPIGGFDIVRSANPPQTSRQRYGLSAPMKDENLTRFKSRVAQLCEKYNIDPSEGDAVFAAPREMVTEKGPMPVLAEIKEATGLQEPKHCGVVEDIESES